ASQSHEFSPFLSITLWLLQLQKLSKWAERGLFGGNISGVEGRVNPVCVRIEKSSVHLELSITKKVLLYSL
ncbi:MAG TPA: hypothetical protein VND68_04460, partial [Chloroflexia bacterium]|nr:hypothetical protein [Chloroflexia bacterium]